MKSQSITNRIMHYYKTIPIDNKVRLSHYNLFQFDERSTNRFTYNASRYYHDDFFNTKKPNIFVNIVQPNDSGYPLTLIEGQLRLVVFDEGIGNYPKPGSYVQYRKKMYFEGDNKQLEKDVINCQYGRNSNKEPIQLILSMSKYRFKAKAFLGPEMSAQMYKSHGSKNKVVVVQIQVMGISQYPFDNNFLELERVHTEIIKDAIEADHAFQNRDIEKSLCHYQSAMAKIFSQYYGNTLVFHKKQIEKEQKQQLKKITSKQENTYKVDTQQFETLVKNRHSLQLIQEYSEKIAIKAIEVALLAKQYLKVIKWAQRVLMNPKYQKNLKVIFIKCRAYIEMNEFERALDDLKIALLIYPEDPMVLSEIHYTQQKKKTYQTLLPKREQSQQKTQQKPTELQLLFQKQRYQYYNF